MRHTNVPVGWLRLSRFPPFRTTEVGSRSCLLERWKTCTHTRFAFGSLMYHVSSINFNAHVDQEAVCVPLHGTLTHILHGLIGRRHDADTFWTSLLTVVGFTCNEVYKGKYAAQTI